MIPRIVVDVDPCKVIVAPCVLYSNVTSSLSCPGGMPARTSAPIAPTGYGSPPTDGALRSLHCCSGVLSFPCGDRDGTSPRTRGAVVREPVRTTGNLAGLRLPSRWSGDAGGGFLGGVQG